MKLRHDSSSSSGVVYQFRPRPVFRFASQDPTANQIDLVVFIPQAEFGGSIGGSNSVTRGDPKVTYSRYSSRRGHVPLCPSPKSAYGAKHRIRRWYPSVVCGIDQTLIDYVGFLYSRQINALAGFWKISGLFRLFGLAPQWFTTIKICETAEWTTAVPRPRLRSSNRLKNLAVLCIKSRRPMSEKLLLANLPGENFWSIACLQHTICAEAFQFKRYGT